MTPAMIPAMLLALACSPPEDWEAVDPPFYSYDDSKTPLVELPADESTWEDLEFPLEQSGGDNGDTGITYSFALAAYYILGVQNVGIGQPFGYTLEPTTGVWEDDDSWGRQVMATITLVRASNVTGRPEFELGARIAMRQLLEDAEEQEDGSLKLSSIGPTALMVMAMTEHAALTGSTEWEPALEGFGAYILSAQNPDGSWSEGSRLTWQQLHKALWELYVHTGEVVYLDALEATGKWHSDNRDLTGDAEPFEYPYLYGLWAAEPLLGLYRERPADWIPELVFSVGDDVIGDQWTPDTVTDETAQYMGGYWANPPNEDGPPNWNHTIKLEAVIDCWRMADEVGDEERAALYRRSALIGTAHLQDWQFRQSDITGWPSEDIALGGMPLYVDDPSIRIDIPAHGGVAMMKVAKYLELEAWPGGY
ncbi:MAG: hypothetical protein VX899_04540 [Myxococcota bacterium]|nr:hypothetical protein [Myxococcota bacterium]